MRRTLGTDRLQFILAKPAALAALLALSACSGGGDSSSDTSSEDVPSSSDTGLDDATDDAIAGADGESDAGPVCPAFCDDGLDCTADSCMGGTCVFEPMAGACTIDGACYTGQELHGSDPCLLCDPATSLTTWSPVPDGTLCDDGSACTSSDACAAGACTGIAKDCDDEDPCTDAACDGATGQCSFAANTAPCDDGDPCTTGDACSAGACEPGAPTCDDDDACTTDLCDAGACSAATASCDDGNPCTADSCAAATGCAHAPQDGAPCEAGDLCLSGDSCVQGACQEGTTPTTCPDDGNPCTTEACLAGSGCVHTFATTACDDGFTCTANDTCNASLCLGEIAGDCGCAPPAFSGLAQKATTLLIGGNGQPGAGLDVDLDLATCAPQLDCSSGIDNAMADLSPFLNPTLTNSIAAGTWVTLAELVAPTNGATPFVLNIYGGLPDAIAAPGCDVQAEVCPYVVLPESIGPNCLPTLSLSDALIDGDTLVAGGPGEVFSIGLPLNPAKPVNLLIFNARIQATVTWAEGGEGIDSIVGVVGGAVPKSVIFDLLSELDPSLLGGLSLEDLLDIVEVVLDEDIDLDGDGKPDAASVGFRIETIPATITGLKAD